MCVRACAYTCVYVCAHNYVCARVRMCTHVYSVRWAMAKTTGSTLVTAESGGGDLFV